MAQLKSHKYSQSYSLDVPEPMKFGIVFDAATPISCMVTLKCANMRHSNQNVWHSMDHARPMVAAATCSEPWRRAGKTLV